MRRAAALVLTVCAAAAAGPSTALGASCPGQDLRPDAGNLAEVRSATLCLLNKERRSRGLRKLRANTTLQRAATKYARQMVAQRFFDHVSPGGSTMTSRIKATSYLRGVVSWSLGENLAWGQGHLASPAETVDAWMHSPGHKANILRGRFTEIGIGVGLGAPVGGEGATYATTFGRRSR